MNIPFEIIEQLWSMGFSEQTPAPTPTFRTEIGTVGYAVLALTESDSRIELKFTMALAGDTYPVHKEHRSFHSLRAAVRWVSAHLKTKLAEWQRSLPEHWSEAFVPFLAEISTERLVVNLEVPVGWTPWGGYPIRAYSDIEVTRDPETNTFKANVKTELGSSEAPLLWTACDFATMQEAAEAAEVESDKAIDHLCDEVSAVELKDGTTLRGCFEGGWFRDMLDRRQATLVFRRSMGARLEQEITLKFDKTTELWHPEIKSLRPKVNANRNQAECPEFMGATARLWPMPGARALAQALLVADHQLAMGVEEAEEANWEALSSLELQAVY